MAHYHLPPAKLTEAEWEKLTKVFKDTDQMGAFTKLLESNNTPHRAGDLFPPEDVRVRGQERFNIYLRRVDATLSLSRVDTYNAQSEIVNKKPREDRVLAIVRKPKE